MGLQPVKDLIKVGCQKLLYHQIRSCSLVGQSTVLQWCFGKFPTTFKDLKNFVGELLGIKGKWTSPGGDVKLFQREGEGEFVLNGMALQGDNPDITES